MATVKIPYKPLTAQHLELHQKLDRFRFSVLVCHRRFGKTVLCINQIIRRAVGASMVGKKNPQYAYIAPSYKQAKNVAWQYLKDYAGVIPGVVFNESELKCVWPNGVKIMLLGSENPDSLRGLYLDGAIIDEAAQCAPNLWGEILRPALSDRQGWAIFIGTPKGRDHFWEKFDHAQQEDDWLAEHLPVSATTVFGDVIPIGEIESARRDMNADEFSQEYDCSFDADSEFILIPQKLLEASVDRQIASDYAPVVAGLDVGMSLGGDSTALVIRRGGQILGIYETHLDDTNEICGWVRSKTSWHDCNTVIVDCIGWGKGVADVLPTLGVNTIQVNFAEKASFREMFARRRDELWWKGYEFFNEKQCCIPSDIPLYRKLISELSGVSYERTPSMKIKVMGKEKMKKEKGKSPNVADAFIYSMADEEAWGADGGLVIPKPKFLAA